MKKKNNNLNISLDKIKISDLRPMARPAGYLLGIIIISGIAYRVLAGQIESMSSKVAAAQKVSNTLQEKVEVLSEFRSILSDSTVNSLNAALPETNSALLMLSQIKELSLKHSLLFSNLNVGTPIEDDSGLFKVELEFDLDGQIEQIIPFLRELKFFAPVNNIREVEFVSGAEASRSTVSIVVYFAEYPSKIPAITDPIINLTASEVETLRVLEGLIIPNFVDLDPSVPGVRANPFE